jgi:hypothetical protein
MSILIKDIPEETWNKLREDHQDELTTMTSIEEDEFNSMIYASTTQQNKLNKDNDFLYKLWIDQIKTDLGFETEGWDNSLRCIIFRRTVNHSEIHEVVLEDYRDDEHVADWLIFSYLKDNITDWYGQKENEQYPLELREYRTFANFIIVLEDLYPLEKDEHPILYI